MSYICKFYTTLYALITSNFCYADLFGLKEEKNSQLLLGKQAVIDMTEDYTEDCGTTFITAIDSRQLNDEVASREKIMCLCNSLSR
jgi:hypothetical protein